LLITCHVLGVVCVLQNNGVQQLASEATVYIVLEDVNDDIPLFTEREQETVLEGEPIGTGVTRVNAIDKDGTFPNNQVKLPSTVCRLPARLLHSRPSVCSESSCTQSGCFHTSNLLMSFTTTNMTVFKSNLTHFSLINV